METIPQEYEKGTLVTFLPFPENKDFKHHGKEGRIMFKALRGGHWYIELDEKVIINQGRPMQKEVNIRVLGLPSEFKLK